MADAEFWMDMCDEDFTESAGSGDFRFPHLLFAMLNDKNEKKWPTLWDIWDRNPKQTRIEFNPRYALFARGTTGEIVSALKKDMNRLKYIAVIGDNTLDIRFIRQKINLPRPKKVSIVGIASSMYWGGVRAYTVATANGAKPWAQMGPVIENVRTLTLPRSVGGKTEDVIFCGIDLGDLIKRVERGADVDPWF